MAFTTSYYQSLAVGCLYLSIAPIETDMTVTKASKHDVLPVNITYPHEVSDVMSNRGGCYQALGWLDG